MADWPLEELGNKTPLQVAHSTNLDYLAQNGSTGLVKTIPDKMQPGSDIGNLAALGYDPKECFSGRAPLEAANLGIDLQKDEIIDENVKIDPNKAIGEYGKSKALATIEVIKGIKKGLNAVIVCPTGIIGPYDYKKSEIGELILEYSKKRIGAYIKGEYDFVDVRDVVEGHILAWRKGKKGEVYILSGEKISIRELFSTLEKYTDVRAPKIHIPATIAKFLAQLATIYYKITKKKAIFTPYAVEILLSNSNISSRKARKELGFRPRAIKESLKDAVRWMLGKHNSIS